MTTNSSDSDDPFDPAFLALTLVLAAHDLHLDYTRMAELGRFVPGPKPWASAADLSGHMAPVLEISRELRSLLCNSRTASASAASGGLHATGAVRSEIHGQAVHFNNSNSNNNSSSSSSRRAAVDQPANRVMPTSHFMVTNKQSGNSVVYNSSMSSTCSLHDEAPASSRSINTQSTSSSFDEAGLYWFRADHSDTSTTTDFIDEMEGEEPEEDHPTFNTRFEVQDDQTVPRSKLSALPMAEWSSVPDDLYANNLACDDGGGDDGDGDGDDDDDEDDDEEEYADDDDDEISGRVGFDI